MSKVKHLEIAGCIVNIREGLHDSAGREVTSIEILCDDLAGEAWRLPDHGDARSINIRVVKQK